MQTEEKLAIIESLTEQPKFSQIGNQSVKAEFPCGCNFVQHAFSGKPQNASWKDNSDIANVKREFFAQLCGQHTPHKTH